MNRTSRARTIAGAVGASIAVLGMALGAWSYQACAVYNSSLIGSGEGIASDAGPACTSHAVPPGRPGADAAGPGTFSVVAAFNTIDIGVSGPADAGIPPLGYDLDNDCTCPGPPSCIPPKGATAVSICDDEAGRDNTDIQLFRLLRGPASTGTSQIDEGLTAGQYGLLLHITDYNGTEDDSKVTVDFYVSNGLARTADGGIPTPRFDGNDSWTIDPGSLIGGQAGGQPVYRDDTAYVSGNIVVAHFPQGIPIAFGDRSFLGGATMQLYGAVIVGKLVPASVGDSDSGNSTFGFALTGGVVAGRWPTSQILSTLATIPQGDGGFLCGTDPVLANRYSYGIISGVICEAADIATLGTEDNTNAPCDAISVGMQFTAVPAKLGPILAVPPAPAGCGDSGLPWTDHCPQ